MKGGRGGQSRPFSYFAGARPLAEASAGLELGHVVGTVPRCMIIPIFENIRPRLSRRPCAAGASGVHVRGPADTPLMNTRFFPPPSFPSLSATFCGPPPAKNRPAPLKEQSDAFMDVFKRGLLGVLRRLLSDASARTTATSETAGHN